MQSPSTSFVQDRTQLSPVNTRLSTSSNYSVLTTKRSTFNLKLKLTEIGQIMREPIAEFAGVAIFVMFGIGVNCQTTLSTNPNVASSPKGTYLSVNFGWAAGYAMAVWLSGGISGGHLNPAFTLAMATWRGFPWRKVPGYIIAQVLGGIFGSAVIYGNYIHSIDIFEGGHDIRTQATASLFATYALPYLTSISWFSNEFLGTAILCLMVVAALDKHNIAPPIEMLPVALFILLLGLGTAFGISTYSFNPAHDFGARLLLTFAGYGKQLYTNQYWFWCPILAPFLGAQVGIGFYDIFLKQRDPADCPPSPDMEKLDHELQNVSKAKSNMV